MAKILKAERAGRCALYYFPVIPATDTGPAPADGQDGQFERFTPADATSDRPDGASSGRFRRSQDPVNDAYQKGFVDGKHTGYESGKQSILSLTSTLESLATELQALREDVYREAERAATSLSIAIARKILGQEIQTSSDVVVGVVRQTIEKIKAQRNIRVKVNPQDLEALESAKCDLADVAYHLETLMFEADPAISPGGCLVESGLGEIDARIDSQLTRIETIFSDLQEQRPSAPACRLPVEDDTSAE